MDLSPVIIAIPLYFTLMAIELMVEAWTNRHTYRLHDAITNINTGVLQQLTGTFTQILKIGLYILIYEKLAFWHIPETWTTFALLFVIWDFCYYWEHRLAHQVSLFWGGHSVHHQSEDYNLSVALRQSSTAFIWALPIYLPLALLGFSPMHFVLVGGWNLIYQFWIHTEHINKMPAWFEAVFNTPSHHRVHHGRDPKYIDKNYAGVFIIWDRLFGTFTREEERPNYGITTPVNTWNPVYVNFIHYVNLFKAVGRSKTTKDSLQILFKPPGWMPDYLGGVEKPKPVPEQYQKFDTPSEGMRAQMYMLVQFVVALGLNAYYFFSHNNMDWSLKVGYALWIMATTLIFGFLFERKNAWLSLAEILRLFCIPLGVYFMGAAHIPAWLLVSSVLFTLGSIGWYLWVYKSKPLRSSIH